MAKIFFMVAMVAIVLSCGTTTATDDTVAPDAVSTDVSIIWTDPTSGLTWQNPPYDGEMLWEAAKQYCTNLPLDGGGWHLPTIKELRTLIRGCDATKYGGSCNVEDGCLAWSCKGSSCDTNDCGGYGGPGGNGSYQPIEIVEKKGDGWYFSSSPIEDYDVDFVWCVDFYYGYVSNCYVGYMGDDSWVSDKHVRCVR